MLCFTGSNVIIALHLIKNKLWQITLTVQHSLRKNPGNNGGQMRERKREEGRELKL